MFGFLAFNKFKHNNEKSYSNKKESICYKKVYIKGKKVKIIHRSSLSILYESHKNNIPENKLLVNISTSFILFIGKKFGTTSTKANQPAERLLEIDESVFSNASRFFLFNLDTYIRYHYRKLFSMTLT